MEKGVNNRAGVALVLMLAEAAPCTPKVRSSMQAVTLDRLACRSADMHAAASIHCIKIPAEGKPQRDSAL